MIKNYLKVPEELKGLIYSSVADTAKKYVFQVHRTVLRLWLDKIIDHCKLITYELEDVVIAYCLYDEKDNYVTVQSIYVKPLFRRQRIGNLLINNLETLNKTIKFSVKTRLLDKLMGDNVDVSK